MALENFKASDYKQVVLLYQEAGLSKDDISSDTDVASEKHKANLAAIINWFNDENRIWHNDLMAIKVDFDYNACGLRIVDKTVNCGIGKGTNQYYDTICLYYGEDRITNSLVKGYPCYVSPNFENLYFGYIKCKNGCVFGLTNDFVDKDNMIRHCCFTGSTLEGAYRYFASGSIGGGDYNFCSNSGPTIYDIPFGRGAECNDIILSPFYVPSTNLYVPDVYRVEGYIAKVGTLYAAGDSVYVNALHRADNNTGKQFKLAFKVV